LVFNLLSILLFNSPAKMCVPPPPNTHEEKMDTYTVLVGNVEGKRPPGRSAYRWNDNIKMDLKVIEWSSGTEFIWLSVGTVAALVNTVMSLRFP
jgi:hypothetical protein